MTQEENKIRKIKQSYELRIENLKDHYSSIIEGKDKLIEKYEDEIKFYRGLIEQLSQRSVVIENKIQNKTNQPGIKELLTNLQQAIEVETKLDNLDKDDALEEVQNLAKASQNGDRHTQTTIAGKSVRRLGRIVNELPDTATLSTVSQEVLPAIANFFD